MICRMYIGSLLESNSTDLADYFSLSGQCLYGKKFSKFPQKKSDICLL